MPGMGTVLNVLAILAGTTIGVGLGNRLPARMRETVMHGLGILTFVLGTTLALRTESFPIVMGSVLAGGVLGELVGIERFLERVGDGLQKRFARSSGTFTTGFVTASLLYCVGPLAILGAIEDGLHRNIDILAVKSVLDGVSSVAFAATLGWGVGFSALSLLVYQGGLTMAAGFAEQFLTEAMITEMTAAGGVLILAIGLRLLELVEVRVANLLPALVLAPVFVAVVSAVQGA